MSPPPPPLQDSLDISGAISSRPSHLFGISSCRTSCQGRLLQFASIEVPIGRRESNLSALGSLRELLSSCRTRLIYTVLSARDALTAFLRKNHRLIFRKYLPADQVGLLARICYSRCILFTILGRRFLAVEGVLPVESRQSEEGKSPRTRTAAVRMRKQGRR